MKGFSLSAWGEVGGMEGLGWLYVPSSLQVVVTHLTTAGPAPDHTAWAQKGLLGPTHARGAAHCPTRPQKAPALSPKTGAWIPMSGLQGFYPGWVVPTPRNTGLSPSSGWAEGPAGRAWEAEEGYQSSEGVL